VAAKLNNYQKMMGEMFQSVGQSIGVHAMMLVVEHAIWKTTQKYEDARLINFSENGIFLEKLTALEPEKSKLVLREFILAIVSTLGRLVGTQLANQLTEKLQKIDEDEAYEWKELKQA